MNPDIPALPAWLARHIGQTPMVEEYPVNKAGMNRLLKAAKIEYRLPAATLSAAVIAESAQAAPEDPEQAQTLMVQVIASVSATSLRNNKARLAAISGAQAQQTLQDIAVAANEDVVTAYAKFRTGTRNTFSHIGPAIFTRFLAAITPEAFVLDSQVAATLHRADVNIDPTGPWSAQAYRTYIDVLYHWAGEFHDPADLELALLNCPPASTPVTFTGDTGRILAHLLGRDLPASTTWGLSTLDKKFGPLAPGTVSAITGEKGSGVSSLMRTIAIGNARRGVSVDLITTLDPGEAWALLLAGTTGVPVAELTNRDNAGRAHTIVDKAPQLAGTVRILAQPDPESNADVLLDDRPTATLPTARRGVAQVVAFSQANPPEEDVDAFIRLERPDLTDPDHSRAGEIDAYDVVNNTGVVLGNALHLGRLVDLGKR
ncbi:8-oxoguanine DNA glycosylase OGG fold protein [Corynebacterium sp. S7]